LGYNFLDEYFTGNWKSKHPENSIPEGIKEFVTQLFQLERKNVKALQKNKRIEIRYDDRQGY